MKQLTILGALLLATWAASGVPPDGDAQIRARAGGSEIVITTTRRLAPNRHQQKANNKHKKINRCEYEAL